MNKKTLGQLLKQASRTTASSSLPDAESDFLETRLSDSLVRGSTEPSATKNGLWLRIYAKANKSTSIIPISRLQYEKKIHDLSSAASRTSNSLIHGDLTVDGDPVALQEEQRNYSLSQLADPSSSDEDQRKLGKTRTFPHVAKHLRIKLSTVVRIAASIAAIVVISTLLLVSPEREITKDESIPSVPAVDSAESTSPFVLPATATEESVRVALEHGETPEAISLDRQRALSAIENEAVPDNYSAFVMNANSGEVLYSMNADEPRDPASLVKMMTLYVTFGEIRSGRISLDTVITVSDHAASQPPSRLGLKSGDRISLRYLIRAVALKSANDAAVATAEGVLGSEAAFVDRMNDVARDLGMTGTAFTNPSGLVADGQHSTARDLSMLGIRMLRDFPEYYNIFGRRVSDAGISIVQNTNRRFLDSYFGADGLMTGYNIRAGFNVVSSAERSGVRLLATVLGGTSTSMRNSRVSALLDYGFIGVPVVTDAEEGDLMATVSVIPVERDMVTASSSPLVERSLRPLPRPSNLNVGNVAVLAASTTLSEDGGGFTVSEWPRLTETYSVDIGHFSARAEANREILATILSAGDALDGSNGQIIPREGDGESRYDARLIDLPFEEAEYVCERMRQLGKACSVVGPEM
jgi:D-alanyl-D-alanine carboxypeptidase